MSDVFKSHYVRAPFKPATTDSNTNVIKYTADVSSKCNELPAEFCNEFVRAEADGGTVQFFFSYDSQAVVAAVAAADAGAQSSQLGEPLRDKVPDQFITPPSPSDPTKKVYFARISDTASTVVVFRKAS